MPPKVTSSTGESGPSILVPDCSTGWVAPEGMVGEDAVVTIELGCTTLLDTVRIKNLAPDSGTTQFSLHISQDQTGPWTQILTAELSQFKVGFVPNSKVIFNMHYLPKDCDQSGNEFNLYNLQRTRRTGRYVRILVESYYGAGGGLSHVSFHGKKAANSNQQPSISYLILYHHLRP